MQDSSGPNTGLGWPDAVVFDLDGTLIDSAADIAAALNEGMRRHGLPSFSLEHVKQMIGGGIERLVARALVAHGVPADSLALLTADVMHIYRENPVVQTELYEGARDVLGALKAQGKRLGLCTNKPQDLTVAILAQLGIPDHFPAVIGDRPGKPLKPDPAPLREVLQMLGVTPERAVMVGDSAADVNCARAADVAVIVIAHGYSAVPAGDLGADVVIGSFSELPEALNRLAPAPARA